MGRETTKSYMKKIVFEVVSITDSSDIADGFDKFFASVGSRLDSHMPSQSSNADASDIRVMTLLFIFPR